MHSNALIRDINKLIELAKTMSRPELAREFGVEVATVSKTAKRNGFTLTEIRNEHRLEVIKDNPTLSIEELAVKLRCSLATLMALVNRGVEV